MQVAAGLEIFGGDGRLKIDGPFSTRGARRVSCGVDAMAGANGRSDPVDARLEAFPSVAPTWTMGICSRKGLMQTHQSSPDFLTVTGLFLMMALGIWRTGHPSTCRSRGI